MSKKDKKRVGSAADQAGEQPQKRQQPQAMIQDEMVYVYPPPKPYPQINITEEDVRVAAAALDAGAAIHPGWAALFRSGLEYAEKKEREAAQRAMEQTQGAGEPSEGSANG